MSTPYNVIADRLAKRFAAGDYISLHELRGGAVDGTNAAALATLEADSRIVWQVGRQGSGRVVLLANLSPLQDGQGDLSYVLAAYLADENVPAAARRAAKTAVRFLTDAPPQCTDGVLMAYASRVLANRLFGIPAEVEAKALEEDKRSQDRRNLKHAAKSLRAYAAEHHLVPLVFPATYSDDAWEQAAVEAWPVGGGPAGNSARSQLRRAGPHVIAALSERGHDPRIMSRAGVEEAVVWLRGRGQWREARGVLRAFADLGKAGLGPYAREDDSDPYYLRHPAGRGQYPLDTPQGLIEALEAHGFQPEFRTAVQYFADAGLLNNDELKLRREDFPIKRLRRHAKETTHRHTMADLRVLLGVAVHGQGRKPETMTVAEIFGPSLASICVAVKAHWVVKFERGDVTARVTRRLAYVLNTAGLFADVMAGRLEHKRRRMRRSDPEALLTATLEEEDFRDAAAEAREMSREVIDQIINTPCGTARNTVKNIRDVVKRTPAAYWLRTLDAMEAEVARQRAKQQMDENHLLLTQATYQLGFGIATGMRFEEQHHTRLDNQYNADRRQAGEVRLRPVDRKAGTEHTPGVDRSILSPSLESYFLLTVRPALVSSEDHPWLFVRSNGSPVGCQEENEDGTGRRHRAYEGRVNRAREGWQEIIAPFAYAANGYVPTGEGEFTPHVVRNAMAAEITSQFGTKQAAEYLGDNEKMVREVYGYLAGKHSKIEHAVSAIRKRIFDGATQAADEVSRDEL